MIDLTPFHVVLVVLATYRLALLVTSDYITRRPRRWLYARSPSGSLSVLFSCPWCVSAYLGAAVTASALWWGDGWGWWLAAVALAASAVTGFLASYAAPDE